MNVSKQSKQIMQTVMFVSSVMFFVVTTNVGSASAHEQQKYGHNDTYQQNSWQSDEHDTWEEEHSNSDSKQWDDDHTEDEDKDSGSGYDESDKQWGDSSRWHNEDDTNEDDSEEYRSSYDAKDNDNSYGTKNKNYEHDQQSYDKDDAHYNQEDRDKEERNSSDMSKHEDDSDKETTHATHAAVAGQQYEYRYEDVKGHEYGKHLVNASDDMKSERYMKSDNNEDDMKNCDENGEQSYSEDHDTNYMRTSYNNRDEHDGKKWGNYGSTYGHGRLAGHHTSWEGEHSMNQNDMAQHLALRSALQEHAAVAMPAFKAELEQSEDREAALAAVDQNSEIVADTVEMIYPDTKDEFSDLWQTHLDAYMTAVHAERDNDDAQKQEAKDALAMFANEASDWFVSQNSDYDVNTLQDMFATHGTQTLSLIEQLAAKDYDAAYAIAHEAYNHMGMLADYLVTMHGDNYKQPISHMSHTSHETYDDAEMGRSSDMMMHY